MEELIAASLIVMVENLSDNVNNAKLREVFFPLHAKRCRVAYIEKEHMGRGVDQPSKMNLLHRCIANNDLISLRFCCN